MDEEETQAFADNGRRGIEDLWLQREFGTDAEGDEEEIVVESNINYIFNLAARIEALGGKEYPEREFPGTRRNFAMPPLKGLMPCGVNDKPPAVHIMVWEGPGLRTVEFLLFGEQNGVWFKATVYSCSHDTFEARYPKVIEIMRQTWQAFTRGIW
jgi:hypothetical protein